MPLCESSHAFVLADIPVFIVPHADKALHLAARSGVSMSLLGG